MAWTLVPRAQNRMATLIRRLLHANDSICDYKGGYSADVGSLGDWVIHLLSIKLTIFNAYMAVYD